MVSAKFMNRSGKDFTSDIQTEIESATREDEEDEEDVVSEPEYAQRMRHEKQESHSGDGKNQGHKRGPGDILPLFFIVPAGRLIPESFQQPDEGGHPIGKKTENIKGKDVSIMGRLNLTGDKRKIRPESNGSAGDPDELGRDEQNFFLDNNL